MTQQLPDKFSYLDDPRIIYSMDYFTDHNFVGRPIAGYQAKVCILTEPARVALIAVQDELDSLNLGYVLKIFDSYRPKAAVADFIRWSQDPHDIKMKAGYYPNEDKPELFKLGYLAAESSHSRGSTVDLTIAIVDPMNTAIHSEMDMGTSFDYFDAKSHTVSALVSPNAQQNRFFFKNLMEKHRFINLPEEWWHFTLDNEPFPDTYFDFPVL